MKQNNLIYNLVGKDLNDFKEIFLKHTIQQFNGKKFFALLLFDENEFFTYNNNDNFIFSGVRYFTDAKMALDAYANTPCPASQLVDGETQDELYQNIIQMINNMKDESWKKINLYPYL